MGANEEAEEITIAGIVQGVGFRPFVYRLARRFGLRGSVRNAGDRVVIHAAGPAPALSAFAAALTAEAPPLARIDGLVRRRAPPPQEIDFRIAASGAGTVSVGVAPDVATCPACLAEIADPAARRHRYAFTNCTDCGPRFSIVRGLPYDRPSTTMAGFAMCPACRAEYEDPADRRFHAQPIACPACGPKLWLEREDGEAATGAAPAEPAPAAVPSPAFGDGAGRRPAGVEHDDTEGKERRSPQPSSVLRAFQDEAIAAATPFAEPGPAAIPSPAGREAPGKKPAGAEQEIVESVGPPGAPGSTVFRAFSQQAEPAPAQPPLPPPNPPPQAGEGFAVGQAEGAVSNAPSLRPDATHERPLPRMPVAGTEAADPILQAAGLLKAGAILAVKGIGGFHIACDATNAVAVATLRQRKHRPAKPLAVMATPEDAAAFSILGPAERAALAHPSAPIVLVPLKAGAALAPGIAPGQRHVGVMLPYTPLHHLLLAATGRPLVMTSGNRANAPQAFRDEEARAMLSGIVDAFLIHDRPIARRLDDSVVRVMAGTPRVMRRGRGLAPLPLALPEDFADAPPVLALGGALKSALCLTHGAEGSAKGSAKALLSHHLGDLDTPATEDAFAEALADYAALFAHTPAACAVDRHPDYRATRLGVALARERGLPLLEVQHHHAHMAAAMAENGWRRCDGPVVGIILDGLGLGDDGTAWGAEILLGDYRAIRRMARLSPIPLAGGDAASREPWRVALAHLDRALGRAAVDQSPHLSALFRDKPIAPLRAMMAKGLNAPMASSAGRLFDAVAAVLGRAPDRLSHEGEAAMALEALAHEALAHEALAEAPPPYPFARRRDGGLIEIDPTPFWSALMADLAAGRAASAMAGAFHDGLAAAFAETAAGIAREAGVTAIALSGGVFQNARLLEASVARLEAQGFRLLLPREVPMGDGGLAFGQAAVAAARLLG